MHLINGSIIGAFLIWSSIMKNTFSDFIANYRNGLIDEILTRELKEVTTAVENMSKLGTLNLSISLKPAGKGKMDVVVTYKSKPPITNAIDSKMFVDKDNRLVATDPNQPTLDLRLVKPDEPKQALKSF